MKCALRRPVVAGCVLLLTYVGLSFCMDPHGYLGADTGAKVATLEVMVDGGTARPVLGYWAADLDPVGELHPVFDTRREGNEWVNVTTLPMLEAARPLYAVGGYRLALLLPMLGAVGAAFAGRSIARRLGAGDGGWSAFWVVGLASPAVIYALDLWEHSLGVACMLGAVAALLCVVQDDVLWPSLGAGVLLGIAASMRTETFVYAVVSVALACGIVWSQTRSLVRSAALGVWAVAGFAVPWLGNAALEAAVGGHSRAARATGSAGSFGSDLTTRAKEGLQTLLGLNGGDVSVAVLLGVVVVLTVLMAFRSERHGDRRFACACLAAAVVVYLFDAAGGLGFIPGLLLAFPLAIAGLVTPLRSRGALLVAGTALGSLPLVYLAQAIGGAAPQWGGRYTLTSALLLGVLGLVGLVERRPVVGRGLIAMSAGVTMLGLSWMMVRTHGVNQFFGEVRARSEPVLISRQAFLLREGGPALVGQRWLSVADERSFTAAVSVARRVGERRFSVLEWGADAPPDESLPDDLREVSRARLTFVDVPVGLVTYEFTRSAK